MADQLRRLLMPATVFAIVATVWALAWSKEIELKAEQVGGKPRCCVAPTFLGEDPMPRPAAAPTPGACPADDQSHGRLEVANIPQP